MGLDQKEMSTLINTLRQTVSELQNNQTLTLDIWNTGKLLNRYYEQFSSFPQPLQESMPIVADLNQVIENQSGEIDEN